MIVAGDFNSTTDMRPFRALLRNGYRDAAEQSGAGFAAHLSRRLAATATYRYRSRTDPKLHGDLAAHDQGPRFGSPGPRGDVVIPRRARRTAERRINTTAAFWPRNHPKSMYTDAC